MPWVSSTYSRTTIVLNVTWTVTVIITFDYHQSCWWHRVFLRQRTVVNADDRGGWTQIFGGKASEPETSLPVEKRNFYLPHLYFSDFRKDLLHHHQLHDHTFSRFATIPTCDWRTDGRTDTQWQQYRASVTSHTQKITVEWLAVV